MMIKDVQYRLSMRYHYVPNKELTSFVGGTYSNRIWNRNLNKIRTCWPDISLMLNTENVITCLMKVIKLVIHKYNLTKSNIMYLRVITCLIRISTYDIAQFWMTFPPI